MNKPKQINIGDKSTIYFGRAENLLPKLTGIQHLCFVTDEAIFEHHPHLFSHNTPVIMGRGEQNKSLDSVAMLYKAFIERNIERSSLIIGVGGGIVTDVAGFAAATYMRGVTFGAVPTTLLSQVDASVGGKTGVNIDGYKNMAGVFSQPRFVICDVELLKTLSDREFRAGLAEIIKAAIIADKQLFATLEQSDIATLRTDNNLLEEIIFRAVTVKARIVELDEREADMRRLLNLGHTTAHAIEKLCTGYNHGEAVAIGVVAAARASLAMGILPAHEVERIERLFMHLGFKIELPVSAEEIAEAAIHDKKNCGEKLWYILPTSIGECAQYQVDIAELCRLLTI